MRNVSCSGVHNHPPKRYAANHRRLPATKSGMEQVYFCRQIATTGPSSTLTFVKYLVYNVPFLFIILNEISLNEWSLVEIVQVVLVRSNEGVSQGWQCTPIRVINDAVCINELKKFYECIQKFKKKKKITLKRFQTGIKL